MHSILSGFQKTPQAAMDSPRSMRLLIVRAPEDTGALNMLYRHTTLYQRNQLLSLVDLPSLLAHRSDTATLLPQLGASADGAIFVISEHFLASAFCIEVQDILLQSPSFVCIPLLYRVCDWQPLLSLQQRQPLPRSQQFIQSVAEPGVLWAAVASDLGDMARKLQGHLGTLQPLPPLGRSSDVSTSQLDLARERIATNQWTNVFEQLLQDSAAQRSLHNEVILLKGRYQQLEFQQSNGLLSVADAQTAWASMRHALLACIDKMYPRGSTPA